MIFVSFGSEKVQFSRFSKYILNIISQFDQYNFIVQSGYQTFVTNQKNCKTIKFCSIDFLIRSINQSSSGALPDPYVSRISAFSP